MSNQIAEILMICDENYASYTATTLTSLFRNNQHLKQIIVHLMINNVSSHKINYLKKLCNTFNRIIYFHDIHDICNQLKHENAPSYKGSHLPLIKLSFDTFQNSLISDRLIYIDSDMIVNKKIDGLLEFDFNDNICAMCEDITINSSAQYKTKLGLEKNTPYYNAGMIVFNTQKWIDNHSKEKVFQYMRKQAISYPFFEQDILNIIFNNSIYRLSPSYNYSASIDDLGISNAYKVYNWTPCFKNDIESIINNVVIYHCLPVKDSRPWMSNCPHPLLSLWNSYTDLNEQNRNGSIDWKPSLSNRILYILKKILPDYIYVPIHKLGLLYYFKTLTKEIKVNKND